MLQGPEAEAAGGSEPIVATRCPSVFAVLSLGLIVLGCAWAAPSTSQGRTKKRHVRGALGLRVRLGPCARLVRVCHVVGRRGFALLVFLILRPYQTL